MARTVNQITWSSATSVSLAAGGQATSDAMAPVVGVYEAALSVRLSFTSAPASGDTFDCYLKLSSDGTNYDSEQPAQLYYLGTIDGADTLTSGATPGSSFVAQKTFTHLPLAISNWKLHIVSNAGQAVTLSADYVEVS